MGLRAFEFVDSATSSKGKSVFVFERCPAILASGKDPFLFQKVALLQFQVRNGTHAFSNGSI